MRGTPHQEKLDAETESLPDDNLKVMIHGSFTPEPHETLLAVLADESFDFHRGLGAADAALLSYRRARLVATAMNPAGDPERLFALNEWIAPLDPTAASILNIHFNLCLGTVLDHGHGRNDLEDYLAELRSMSSIGLYMATELGYGNNAADMKTEAVYDPRTQEFVLHTPSDRAQKFMPNTGVHSIPKLAVVMARLKTAGEDHGVLPFIVRISDSKGLCPGVRVSSLTQKPGMVLDNGMTRFDHVRIPRRNLLSGKMGELSADGVFRGLGTKRRRCQQSMSRVHAGRVGLLAGLVSTGRASVYIAIRYSLRRETFAAGRPHTTVMDYRSHQLPVLGSLAEVYAISFLTDHVKRQYLAGRETKEMVSIAKAVGSWTMSKVIHSCRERCGAQGMFSVNRIADYVSFAQGVVTAEGDNLVILAAAAHESLSRRENCVDTAPPCPLERSLLDAGFHLELLRYRENTLRSTVRRRLDDARANGATVFAGWNANLNQALAMARTRGVAAALEQFLVAVERTAAGPLRQALTWLSSLYAVLEVGRDAGWYLAKGVLTAEQVERIPDVMDELCALVLPFAELLVDEFALTPDLLRAPIAAEDYVEAVSRFTDVNEVSPSKSAGGEPPTGRG